MNNKVENYDNSIPKLKSSLNSKMWSLLFLYDQAFGISAKVRDKKSGDILSKVHNGTKTGNRFLAAHQKNVKDLINQNQKTTYTEPIELPSISSEEFKKEDFKYWRRKIGTPLVVREYLKNEPISNLMSEQNLVPNYGDKEIKCIKITRDAGQSKSSTIGQNQSTVTTTLEEFLTSDQFIGHYINNYFGVIDDDTFLKSCKGYEINELMDKKHVLSQWFISRPDMASGSTLHCAGADNIFLNVKGQKEWYFVDPSYTSIMQPAMSKYGSFCVSELEDNIDGEFYTDFLSAYDEMKHVPIYKTVLKEGDMLYNPSWWWHRVKNLSKLNIGCATRFVDDRIAFNNSPTLWSALVIEALKSPKKSLVTQAKKSLGDKKNAPDLINSIFTKEEKNSN